MLLVQATTQVSEHQEEIGLVWTLLELVVFALELVVVVLSLLELEVVVVGSLVVGVVVVEVDARP